MLKWKIKSMNTTKTGIVTDAISFIRSNPISTPLTDLIIVHELIKMNEELLVKYTSLEDALKLIAGVIEQELE